MASLLQGRLGVIGWNLLTDDLLYMLNGSMTDLCGTCTCTRGGEENVSKGVHMCHIGSPTSHAKQLCSRVLAQKMKPTTGPMFLWSRRSAMETRPISPEVTSTNVP